MDNKTIQTRMITDKQLSYVKDLLNTVDQVILNIGLEHLTTFQASKLIDLLNEFKTEDRKRIEQIEKEMGIEYV